MDQLDLLAQELTATDAAIDQVGANADPEWLEQARDAITQLAHDRATFIADNISDTGLPKPREARAIGNIIRWAARQRLIVGTDQFLPSAQQGSHCVPRRVWRSLVYEDAAR